MTPPVVIGGKVVHLSPTAADALHGLLGDHQAKRETPAGVVHPACRARLIPLGLVHLVAHPGRNGTGLHLTPLGVTIATHLEQEQAA